MEHAANAHPGALRHTRGRADSTSGVMAATTPAPARILVVEDALFTRKLLTTTLQAAGYVVDAAHSLAGALDLIAKHPPDVAVVDIFLADCASGLNIAQALRTQRNTALTFIVAISGHHAPDCVRLCHGATPGG